MPAIDLEKMSKESLVRELEKLLEVAQRDADARRAASGSRNDPLVLLHDLQVHQVELEMQNRELREAQQRLEQSRSRYADLYDFAPLASCTLDGEGVVREANLATATLLGRSRSSLLGKSLSTLISTDADVVLEHLRRCVQDGMRVTTECGWSVPGFARIEVQMTSTKAKGEDGQVIFRTALVDVTALRESEQRLRFLSEAGEVLARSLDYEDVLRAVVRLAVPMFADLCLLDVVHSRGAVERLEVTFADPDKQRDLAEPLKAFAPRAEFGTPEAVVLASGKPLLVREIKPGMLAMHARDSEHAALLTRAGVRSLMVVPLMARGATLGVLSFGAGAERPSYGAKDLAFAEEIARRAAIAMDNSRLYSLAQRAVRARDHVLSVVSHDLRNPLGAISLAAARLLDDDGARRLDRAGERKIIERIRRAAQSMNRLVGDLLDVVSMEAGRLALERHEVNLSLLLSDAREMMQPIADKAEVNLTVRGPDSDAAVYCDRERILQALSNLIGNAAKFTPKGGSVSLSSEVDENTVCFAVADTGPGISSEELPHVFEPLWQSKETAHLGTGLGLTIAKDITEAHGGQIRVESLKGHSCTFFVRLPRSDARQESTVS